MCDPISMVVGAVASAAVSAYQGNKQAKAQKSAQQQAQANADRQAKAAEEDFNRRNMKRPNVQNMMAGNALAAQSGQSGTMLTGPMGIDPMALTLGKSTLLGGGA